MEKAQQYDKLVNVIRHSRSKSINSDKSVHPAFSKTSVQYNLISGQHQAICNDSR